MPEEVPTMRYRLTLDFEVFISTEMLEPYSDEDELDEEEQRKLKAQRNLLRRLLSPHYRYLLDELIRKRVLEDAAFEVEYETVKDAARVRDIEEDVLLEPAIDSLSVEDQTFFQEASERKRFNRDADEVVYSVGVDLIDACLQEVDPGEKEDEY